MAIKLLERIKERVLITMVTDLITFLRNKISTLALSHPLCDILKIINKKKKTKRNGRFFVSRLAVNIHFVRNLKCGCNLNYLRSS